MALTHVYVDATIDGDSGSGTTGDPYGDLQYALDQSSSGSGHVFWLYGAEVLTGVLDFSTFGAVDHNSPCLIRGWNGSDATTAGANMDTGSISGNNGNFNLCATKAVSFRWLKLFNTGTAFVLDEMVDYHSIASECEICDSTGGGVDGDAGGAVHACNIHDITGIGIDGPAAWNNYLKNGSVRKFTTAISPHHPGVAHGNILSLDGASNGIALSAYSSAIHNSILSSSGTGVGISGSYDSWITNNLIEGFSGAGGDAVDSVSFSYHGCNGYYNCTNGFDWGVAVLDLGDDEALSATPFAKSGSDTFANRFTHFAPADTGNVRGGAYPSGCRLDKGAVQHADPAGGGGGRRPRGLYLGV